MWTITWSSSPAAIIFTNETIDRPTDVSSCIYVENGALNIPAELYYPVRIKSRGDFSMQTLLEKGIDHIELRRFPVKEARMGVPTKRLSSTHRRSEERV